MSGTKRGLFDPDFRENRCPVCTRARKRNRFARFLQAIETVITFCGCPRLLMALHFSIGYNNVRTVTPHPKGELTMKTLFLMLVIGPCLLAQAADPNDNTPTEKKIIVTTVKEAVKLPAATADKTPDFNITVVETADPTAKKLNLKTATVEGVRALADKKPMKFVLTTVDAAKPTPFKDKIVRVQAVAANLTQIFT